MANPASSRMVSLDALRGLSILLVVAYHVARRFPADATDPIASALFETGWAGVDLFFAISGFLITRILISGSGWEHLRGFFVKRFFRIFPLYFVALVVYAAASLVTGLREEIIARMWVNAAFLTAWAVPVFGSSGTPFLLTWSVSVEETAYLLFALLSLLGFASFRRSLAVIVALALLLRIWVVYVDLFDPRLLYFFAPARLDVVASGGLAALLPLMVRLSVRNLVMVAGLVMGTLGVFAVMGDRNPFVVTVGYSVLGLAAAQLVALLAGMPVVRPRWWLERLARIGRVSYFIYLFHMFVIQFFAYVLPVRVAAFLGYWPLLVLVTAATYLAALVSWKFFERPLIDLGRRIAEPRAEIRPSLQAAAGPAKAP